MTNANKDIRIIQISDCHFSSDGHQQWFGRNPEKHLDLVIDSINKNEPEDSIVLATGDLSHDGSEKSYKKLFQNFSNFNKAVYTLAGNHDDSTYMDKYLNQQQISTVPYFSQGNWLVLMLNTQVQGQEHGLISKQQMQHIKETLDNHKDKYTLIAMHHPSLKINCAWIDKINLLNADTFIDFIANYTNIKAVTYGHVHQDYTTVINDVDHFTCPSTCHQYLPHSNDFATDSIEAGYRWFDLKYDGKINSGVVRVANINNDT